MTPALKQRQQLFDDFIQFRGKLKEIGHGAPGFFESRAWKELVEIDNDGLNRLYKMEKGPETISRYLGAIVLEKGVSTTFE